MNLDKVLEPLQAFPDDLFELLYKKSVSYRVVELGSLSSGAKMAMKIFVKRVFTILQIANLQT